MSFSFLFPDSGLSFKQLYVHPVSPIKMRRNTLVSPKRVQVYIQRETRQTLERKTPAHPRRLRAGTDKVCCLSGRNTFKYRNEGTAWRDLVKFLGGNGAALVELQGVNISAQILWASWDRQTVLSIQHEARAMGQENHRMVLMPGEAWDPRGKLEPAMPPRGGSRQHTSGEGWRVPRTSWEGSWATWSCARHRTSMRLPSLIWKIMTPFL